MGMKKLIILLFFVGAGFGSTAQQYNLGYGIRAGVANFLGDIGNGDAARGFVFNMDL